MVLSLLPYIDKNKARIKKIWNELHAMPEKGFGETMTSDYLAGKLEGLGCKVERGIGRTGLIGTVTGKEPGPVVGIRAEMDALEHVYGTGSVMKHTCGHDANCTMALSAFQSLVELNLVNKGTLMVLFQPSEENLQGAKEVIKSGRVDNLDYLLGIHLRPSYELAHSEATSGLLHSATTALTITVKGKPAHASRADLGINAVEIASTIVVKAGLIKMDPMLPHSLKVTKFSSGNSSLNVIPDYAEICFDLRAQSDQGLEMLTEALKTVAKGEDASSEIVVDINIVNSAPAAVSHPLIEKTVESAIIDLLGEEGFHAPFKTMGAEDFHYYPQMIEGLQSTIVGIGADVKPGLHIPEMSFNTDALLNGTHILANSALKLLQKS